jgi:hypothetical protein
MTQRKLVQAFAAIVIVALLILGGNYMSVGRYAQTVTARPGNNVVTIWSYHAWGILPGTLVVDVRAVHDGMRPVDVLRVLFDIAEQAKDRQFSEVRLAYRGETKFLLDAEHFRTIGRERAFQNPVFVMNNLPAALLRPDGTAAFATWTGGLLGVVARQAQDVNAFMDEWFMRPSGRTFGSP